MQKLLICYRNNRCVKSAIPTLILANHHLVRANPQSQVEVRNKGLQLEQ